MTKTLTSRMGQPQWSAGTDTVGRSDFNAAFLNIETWAARDEQGLASSRPAFGIRGRYYYATDTQSLYRDTGTAWISVGGVVENAVMTASSASSIAGVFRAASGQTANLVELRNSSATVQSALGNDGSFKAGGTYIVGGGIASALRRDNATVSVNSLGAALPGLIVRGASAQTADLLRLQNNGGSNVASVSAAGVARFANLSIDSLIPVNEGDVVPRKYLHDNFVTLAGGTINTSVDIAAPSDAVLSASTVGSSLSIKTSRVTSKDTTAARFFPDGSVQVGGLTGAQAASVPMTVVGAAAQAASFFEVKNNGGTVLSKIDQFGAIFGKALDITMPTGWSSNGISLKNAGAIEQFRVDQFGNIYSRNFRSGTTADRIASLNTSNLNTGAFWWDTSLKKAFVYQGGWNPIMGRDILSGTAVPGPGDGNDGDLYFQHQ